MEQFLIALVASLGTGFGAWLLHKRESKKVDQAGGVATAALHTELDTRMKAHVHFVEERIATERRWFHDEIQRERDECAESINTLAGRLGLAEAELRKLRGAKGNGGKGGLPPSSRVEGGGS